MLSVVADPCGHSLAPRSPVPSQLEGLRPDCGALFGEGGMMGVFVQTNEGTRYAKSHPLGYVIEENGCWEWVGCHTRDGYGTVFHNGKSGQKAHRMMYEKCVEAIPPGLELDHKCRNRGCVNPDHLEAVTPQENWRRGNNGPAQNARKTHCVNGHEFVPENTLRYSDRGRLTRSCRTCRRATYHRNKHRRAR